MKKIFMCLFHVFVNQQSSNRKTFLYSVSVKFYAIVPTVFITSKKFLVAIFQKWKCFRSLNFKLYLDINLYLRLLFLINSMYSLVRWPFIVISCIYYIKKNSLNCERKLTDGRGGTYSTSAKESIELVFLIASLLLGYSSLWNRSL